MKISQLMILSDRTINDLVNSGEIVIKPYKKENVQSASVDLRLGSGFLVPDYHNIKSVSLNDKLNYTKIKKSKIFIPSNHFILGTTLEYLEIPNNICGRLDGRSTIGRKSLWIQSAGHINPGYKGKLTLEFFNAGDMPFELNSGDKICQIIFMYTDKRVEKKYSGKYQGQIGVTGAK